MFFCWRGITTRSYEISLKEGHEVFIICFEGGLKGGAQNGLLLKKKEGDTAVWGDSDLGCRLVQSLFVKISMGGEG